MEHVLAIDCGTQSTRALLFDARGELLHGARVPYAPYVSPKPGWAEQDPDVYWNALGQACRALWAQGADPARVRGVAVTTQRGTVVNVGENGRPLRPAIVWLDQRRTDGVPRIGGAFGALARTIGLGSTLRALQADTEANWIARYEPEVWRATRHYLLLSGYLNFRLTGEYRDSSGSQVGYLPFDYRRQTWAQPRAWQWEVAPFDPATLPELVPPASPLGEVTRDAAEHTGLRIGTPVIAAAADKACEVLGCGVNGPGIACISYGTAASLTVTQHRYGEPRPFVPPFPAAVAGSYNLEVQLYRGYWMVSWFKEQFAHAERSLAEEQGVEPETLFERLLDEVPPGSHGLMLQPYWSPGVRVPGPEAKGAIIGFGGVHTRAHLYRAIIEGLAYGLRDAKEHLERTSRAPLREVRVAGGGSRSDGVMQITANVFGLPVSRPHVAEASGLGAAVSAAVGVGLHPDVGAAVRAMTRPGTIFEPEPDASRTYDALFRQVYRRMYPNLRPLYRKIQDITGYPASLG